MLGKAQTILQGDALQAFIDKAFALLDEDENSVIITENERKAAVSELMQPYRFIPATVDELRNLHRLWHNLEQPETALAVITEHRHSILQSLCAPQRAAASIRLALAEIDSLQSMGDSQALPQRLQETAEQLAAQPRDVFTHDYWYDWNTAAMDGECFDVIEWALDKGYPAYGWQGAWSDRLSSIQPFLQAQAKANLAHQRGNPDAVQRHLQTAVQALLQASRQQAIDWYDWAALAEFAIEVSPEQVERILQVALKYCSEQDASPNLPLARHRQIMAARLRAQACHLLGDLPAALDWAEQGFFELPHWDFEEFVLLRLELLQQAEQWLPLAQLTLHVVLHDANYGELLPKLWQLAQEWAGDNGLISAIRHADEVRMTGAVIIAFHYIDAGKRRWLREQGIDMPSTNEEQEKQALHWLNQAREHCPQHPLADLLEGWYYTRKKAPNWASALSLLEQSLPLLPEHASHEFLGALWLARFKSLKVTEALARPFIPSEDGYWCAQLAYDLQVSIPNKLGKKLIPDRLEPLIQRYRQEGLQHFETFWQSGQGRFFSANCSWYASLCAAVADYWRKQQRYLEARDLYQRAIAARADHCGYQIPYWQALLQCTLQQGDDEAAIGFAESLWHAMTAEYNGHTQDDGYKGYYPGSDCVSISQALHRLGRDLEITIWLDRLMQWLGEQKPEDSDTCYRLQRDCQSDTLEMLSILAIRHSTAAIDYLQAQINGIRAIGDTELLNKAEQLLQTYKDSTKELTQ